MRIERARADAEEAQALTALAQMSKAHWGYAEEDLARWRPELTFSVEELRRDDLEVRVARGDAGAPRGAGDAEGGAPLGMYALERDREDPARVHLEHFWVDPRAMGAGVGRALFRDAERRARALGGRVLEIESDPRAEGFYLRMGARRVGEVAAPAAGAPGRVLPVLERALI